MKKLKSIGAVIAGFITVVVLSIGTDAILEGMNVFPSQSHPELYTWDMLFIALVYRSVYTIVGGYVTASIPSANPMQHVAILGILGLIAGTAGVIIGWTLSAHWYPITLAVTAFPLTWLGGKMRIKRMQQTPVME
jgi:hypothetical protein